MRFIIIILFVVVFISGMLYFFTSLQDKTIKIGLLYSKTGTMSKEEQVLSQVLHYQVEKINQEGGLLHKYVEIVEYDGASNEKEFAKGAEFLINKGVETIFGAWTSASRKAIKPIIERENALLFYPVQYEGIEESENIIYLGSVPNQQIRSSVSYIKNNFGKKIYIVGSDSIYPRINHIYIQEFSKLIGMDLLGASHVPLGTKSFKEVVQKIAILKPDVIINTLNASANSAFFNELKQQKIDAKQIRVFSTSIDEVSLKYMGDTLGTQALNGHYIMGSYFNSIDNIENVKIRKNYEKRYGKDFILTDVGFNVHMAFEFYKRAVINIGSVEAEKLLREIHNDTLESAAGILCLDDNNHLHKKVRISKIQNNRLDIVWESEYSIQPKPFPSFKNKQFWEKEQNRLYENWDESWQSNGGGAL